LTRGRSGGRAAGGVRRADRVASEIQRILSAELLRRVRDPRVTHVTITRVRVNDDLRLARIFFTLLDVGEGDRVAAQQGLASAAPFFRRTVAGELGLRHAPELVFAYDDDLASARRIDTLLKGLRGDDRGDDGEGGDDGDDDA
jgi:ribosome-binding factor A